MNPSHCALDNTIATSTQHYMYEGYNGFWTEYRTTTYATLMFVWGAHVIYRCSKPVPSNTDKCDNRAENKYLNFNARWVWGRMVGTLTDNKYNIDFWPKLGQHILSLPLQFLTAPWIHCNANCRVFPINLALFKALVGYLGCKMHVIMGCLKKIWAVLLAAALQILDSLETFVRPFQFV